MPASFTHRPVVEFSLHSWWAIMDMVPRHCQLGTVRAASRVGVRLRRTPYGPDTKSAKSNPYLSWYPCGPLKTAAFQATCEPRVPYTATQGPGERRAMTIIRRAPSRQHGRRLTRPRTRFHRGGRLSRSNTGATPDGRRFNPCLLACMWQAYSDSLTPHDLACVVLAVLPQVRAHWHR